MTTITIDKELLEHALEVIVANTVGAEDIEDALRATLAAPATAPATAPEQQECKWTFDDDESNTWASGCGELWTYIDGGPSENRVKYCHGCGKPVVLEDKP